MRRLALFGLWTALMGCAGRAQPLSPTDNSETPIAQPSPETDPGEPQLPEGLTSTQVSSVMREHSPDLVACRQHAQLAPNEVLVVDIVVTIEPTGWVSRVYSEESNAAAQCAIEQVSGYEFPPFSGPHVDFSMPLRIH